MSCGCGNTVCNCQTTQYSYNWNPIPSVPCNPCSTTIVCKKVVDAKCVKYTGPNLTNLGLTTNINLEYILTVINALINNGGGGGARISTDPCNAITLGTDGGLFLSIPVLLECLRTQFNCTLCETIPSCAAPNNLTIS